MMGMPASFLRGPQTKETFDDDKTKEVAFAGADRA